MYPWGSFYVRGEAGLYRDKGAACRRGHWERRSCWSGGKIWGGWGFIHLPFQIRVAEGRFVKPLVKISKTGSPITGWLPNKNKFID